MNVAKLAREASLARAVAAAASVPLPARDPVHGEKGPLFGFWRERE